jgi:hypothetical protein
LDTVGTDTPTSAAIAAIVDCGMALLATIAATVAGAPARWRAAPLIAGP